MRLAILGAILFLIGATQADSRECRLPSPRPGVVSEEIPPRSFFLCLLAEIDDLKKRQEELERIVPEYERLVAEMPVPYLNDNGKVTVEEGRRIGSATFTLDARQTGRASSLRLDQAVIEELCTTTRGCRMSLIRRVIGLRQTEPLESIIVGPCLFDYDAVSGAWLRGTGCSGDAISGKDGDGAVGAKSSGADVVIEAGEGCLMADADIRLAVGADHEILDRDHSRGLYLIAAPERLTTSIRRFRCDLEID
ncbi:hypothetical protein [Ostreiculturibacter nitratireducens]|uniref:hypothetical protein n=1 Tax=Ostreiculturibacter nitratireducens TaxID=3075226 RepID=UPI0031B59DC6